MCSNYPCAKALAGTRLERAGVRFSLALLLSSSLTLSAYASETIGTITSATTMYPIVCYDAVCSDGGRVNMRPTINSNTPGATAINITDTAITGHAYGEDIGWIKFDVSSSQMPATMTPVKVNPTTGVISGYAYANTGSWINFAPTTVSGGQTVGVTINSTGQWNGYAWVSGINGGWMKFDCVSATSTSCITTDWRPIPNRTPTPSGGGGGGGGGGGIIVTPTTPAVTNNTNVTQTSNSATKFGDENMFSKPVNQPNESTPILRSDVNDDGVVGIFDYNLLMVNWSTASQINEINGIISSTPSYLINPKKDPSGFAKKCKGSNVADINCDGKVDIFDLNLIMINWGKKMSYSQILSNIASSTSK